MNIPSHRVRQMLLKCRDKPEVTGRYSFVHLASSWDFLNCQSQVLLKVFTSDIPRNITLSPSPLKIGGEFLVCL